MDKIYNTFASKIMDRLCKGDENVVFSPLSIFAVMCMAAAGASGETRKEILDAIGGGLTVDELISVSEYIKSSGAAVQSANALCVRQDLGESIKKEYLKLIRNSFDAEYFASNDLVDDVNRWVSKKTEGMIPKILDDSAADIICYLVNATSFICAWGDPYDEFNIRKRDFHNASGSVSKVNMLYDKERSYVEGNYVRGFIKPYKDKRYAFMALLPKRKGKDALDKAIKNIRFDKLLDNSTWDEVHTSMPEFEYRTNKELSSMFRDMGVNKMFEANADFSNMSMLNLFVNQIIHDAYIKVDRYGTKAAAATLMPVCGSIPPMDYKTVTINRPFIYAIMDVEKRMPVFSGVVREL